MIEGKKAKNFEGIDQNGEKISLKNIKEKVVLYFYPKDNTPGCTLEAKGFTDLKKEFEKENVKIIGVSKDNMASHQKFCEKHGLDISLLSDPDFLIHKDFEAFGLKKFMGREFKGTIRSTVLIDENKKIIKHWSKVKAIGHAQEVLEFVKNLS
jgi:peroxiredoxin Q/BCP